MVNIGKAGFVSRELPLYNTHTTAIQLQNVDFKLNINQLILNMTNFILFGCID